MCQRRDMQLFLLWRGVDQLRFPDADSDYQQSESENWICIGNLVEIQNIHNNYNKQKTFEYRSQ